MKCKIIGSNQFCIEPENETEEALMDEWAKKSRDGVAEWSDDAFGYTKDKIDHIFFTFDWKEEIEKNKRRKK